MPDMPVAHRPLPGVNKIAVLRANGIGDLVFALPALKALKTAYPSAALVLLGADWHGPFLDGRGVVDRVVTVPAWKGVREGRQDERQAEAFFAAMQAERFDLALQLHGGGRYSNPFVRRLGARVSAGLRTPDAEPLDINVPYVYFQPEVMRYLEVAAEVGAPPIDVEPCLPLTERDHAEAEAVLEAVASPVVALNPGASDPRRRWHPSKFAAAGDALAAEGASIILTGSAADASITREVRSRMRAPCTDLAGCLSLDGLAGVLGRCNVVVSNDSGPLHLAAAAGAATVGIFWCGNLINAGRMTRMRHRPLLSWRLECSVCGANTITAPCDHRESFVDEVSVEAVIEQALDLLQLRRPQAPRS